jgi:hypothetical protein
VNVYITLNKINHIPLLAKCYNDFFTIFSSTFIIANALTPLLTLIQYLETLQSKITLMMKVTLVVSSFEYCLLITNLVPLNLE